MKKTLTQYDIANELMQDTNANWSYNGAYALANYLQELEDNTSEEMEMDVVAIRCEYSQYDSLESWADDYFGGDAKTTADALGLNVDMSGVEFEQDAEEVSQVIREYIQDHGQLIEFDGGTIVSSF